MTVKKLKKFLIEEASPLDLPALEARLILSEVTALSEEMLILNENKELTKEQEEKALGMLNKRLNGIPMAYILGYKDFYSHKFTVSKDVLIPQPDTETLVETTIRIAKKKDASSILDLCTGSGAIAASVAYELGIDVSFSDISESALEIAIGNYERITGRKAKAECGSLFTPWKNHKFDIITSNPPYLTQQWYNEASPEVKNEPELALLGFDDDGLGIIREIIRQSPDYLNNDGYLILETDYRQIEKCATLFSFNNFKEINVDKDLNGRERVIYARR